MSTEQTLTLLPSILEILSKKRAHLVFLPSLFLLQLCLPRRLVLGPLHVQCCLQLLPVPSTFPNSCGAFPGGVSLMGTSNPTHLIYSHHILFLTSIFLGMVQIPCHPDSQSHGPRIQSMMSSAKSSMPPAPNLSVIPPPRCITISHQDYSHSYLLCYDTSISHMTSIPFATRITFFHPRVHLVTLLPWPLHDLPMRNKCL